jgi:diadenosine tetraphosphate (Ap4A) HIT family hydrolase
MKIGNFTTLMDLEMGQNIDCIFCTIDKSRVITENDNCIAFYDKFPVSKGHILVIHKKHEADYFNLNAQEQSEIWNFTNEIKSFLEQKFEPNGFNIGINIGPAAGQTIFHCHIHIIPRYDGDIKNPRGGVRGVIPDKMNYRDT